MTTTDAEDQDILEEHHSTLADGILGLFFALVIVIFGMTLILVPIPAIEHTPDFFLPESMTDVLNLVLQGIKVFGVILGLGLLALGVWMGILHARELPARPEKP